LTHLLNHDILAQSEERKMSDNEIKKYITSDPQIHHGKACFRRTRIPVYIILELMEAGQTPKEVLEGYPRLTKKHIEAALHFAAEILKNREYVAFA